MRFCAWPANEPDPLFDNDMRYKYVAATKTGELKKGTLEAGSRQQASDALEGRGLIVVSIRGGGLLARFGRERMKQAITGVGHMERLLFTKHLSVMIRSGLTLIESLRILRAQTSSWRFRIILGDLITAVERGGSLANTLAEYSQAFDHFYVNIVRVGEVTGNLEQNLNHLAEQLTRDHELRTKVKSAMFYPAIVMFAALAIAFVFAVFVIPQIAGLFTGLKGIKMPLITVIMLKTADFLRKNTLASFFGLFGGIAFIIWFLRRKFLWPVTHWLTLNLPAFGKIAREINLARFTMVYHTLLRSGVPIAQAATIASQVVSNRYYQNALERVYQQLQTGRPLAEILEDQPKLFPVMTTRMIAVGEHSGRLEEVLAYLADFYSLEVDNAVKTITNIIEPAMLLVIGLFAMALAFAIIVPIYNFIGAISTI